MDRVAFLMEDRPGTLLECLLNPESLLLHRTSGISGIRSAHGTLTGTGMKNTPVIFRGGGVTELELYLLFDINLQRGAQAVKDVRHLTKPLWDLTKSNPADPASALIARFIWGKSWNIPGVVINLSENLEQFTAAGIPQRSWLSMRFREVDTPRHRKKRAVATQKNSNPTEQEAAIESIESAAIHFLSGGTSFQETDDTPGTDNKISNTDELIQQLLSKTGLGTSIQNTVNSARSLLDDLWETLANNEAAQNLKKSFDNVLTIFADLAQASGTSLLKQYTRSKEILDSLVNSVETFVSESIVPLSHEVHQKIQGTLSNISGQAREILNNGKKLLRELKKAALSILSEGTTWVYSTVKTLQRASKKTLQEIGELGGDIISSISAGLEKVLSNGRHIIDKGADWLLKPLIQQLGKLPGLIKKAWQAGNRQAAKLAESILNNGVQAIHLLRRAGDGLDRVTEQSPLIQIDERIDQLQANLILPVEEQDNIFTTHKIKQLVSGIDQLPDDENQLVLQTQLSQFISSQPTVNPQQALPFLSEVKQSLQILKEVQIEQEEALLAQVIQTTFDKKPDVSIKPIVATTSERLDQLAFKYYGNAALWRKLAYANDVVNPLRLPGNLALKIPDGGT